MFKSYIFVRTELKNELFVLQTSGVSGIVKLGNNIAVIPDKDINAIQTMVDGELKPEGMDFFIKGDKVEIYWRAFERFAGNCCTYKRRKSVYTKN